MGVWVLWESSGDMGPKVYVRRCREGCRRQRPWTAHPGGTWDHQKDFGIYSQAVGSCGVSMSDTEVRRVGE